MTAVLLLHTLAYPVRIPASVWRKAAADHAENVCSLLKPGFEDHKRAGHQETELRALDRRHPVYNFLTDYYHVKGVKGVRSLARWSPPLHPGGTLLEGACEEAYRMKLLTALEQRVGQLKIKLGSFERIGVKHERNVQTK